MAYITHFEIKGLAGRSGTFARETHSPVVLFFGSNGCGKTSLLKLLDAALRLDAIATVRIPFKSATIVSFDPISGKEFCATINKPDLRDLQDAAESIGTRTSHLHRQRMIRRLLEEQGFGWSICPKPDPESAPDHRFMQTNRISDLSSSDRSSEDAIDYLDYAYERYLGRYWQDYSNELQSQVSEVQQECIAGILRTVLSHPSWSPTFNASLDTDVAFQKSISFLKRNDPGADKIDYEAFDSRLHSDPVFRSVVSKIITVETQIEAIQRPTSQLNDLVQRLFSGPKKIQISSRTISLQSNNGEPFGLNSLSSGEKQLLLLLVAAARVGQSSLIIDEPELSMHVDWQRHFVQSIFELNDKCQLIMATHSPDIMAYVDESTIYRLPE